MSLALLRGSGLPLMGPVQIFRALFLSIAGMVTRKWYYRVAVVAALFAASLLLTARALTTPDAVADLGLLSIGGLILALIAMVVVAGVTAVPLLRAIERNTADRYAHGAVGLLLLLAGGVAATAAVLVAGLSPAQVIVAVGFDPPSWVTAAPFALVLGYATIKVPLVGRALAPLLRASWVRGLSLALVAVAAGTTIYWSVDRIVDDGRDEWWAEVLALAPLAGLAIAGLYVFVQAKLLRVGRRRAAARVRA